MHPADFPFTYRYWLLALLPMVIPLGLPAQDTRIFAGEVTVLSISPLPGDRYFWELYSEPVDDFVLHAGNCSSDAAAFIENSDYRPAVQVKWYQPGTYYFKITALNESGCSNFMLGKIEVADPRYQIRIFPNPVTGNQMNIRVTLPEDSGITADLCSLDHQFTCRVYEGEVKGGVPVYITFRKFLPQGVYAVRIRTRNALISSRVVVISVY